MATTVLGDDSVPKTKFQALAGELRVLKSGMADMQVRLDALLSEISELEQACDVSEPTGEVEVLPERQDVEPAMIIEVATAIADPLPEAELAAEGTVTTQSDDAEAAIVAEAEEAPLAVEETRTIEISQEVATIAATELTTIESVEVIETVETIETTTEAPVAEIADVAAPAELVAEIPVIADLPAIAVESEPAPAVAADIAVEPVAVEAVTAEAPVVATLTDNVVVLAERRAAPRKARAVIARTARWAAAIVLIVMAAAITATGTGFAGNGELLTIKDVCAIAGDVCSIVSGIP